MTIYWTLDTLDCNVLVVCDSSNCQKQNPPQIWVCQKICLGRVVDGHREKTHKSTFTSKLLSSTASVNINTNPIITVFLSLIRTPLISVTQLYVTFFVVRLTSWLIFRGATSTGPVHPLIKKIPSAQRQNIPQSRPIRPIWPISPLCTCKITSECTVQHHHQRSKQLLFKISVRIHLAKGEDSLEL